MNSTTTSGEFRIKTLEERFPVEWGDADGVGDSDDRVQRRQ
jgi:hypothetical protein